MAEQEETGGPSRPRTVEVRPAATREFALVLRVAGLVLLVAALAAGWRPEAPAENSSLLPYQDLFHELPEREQIVVRELRVAVEELRAGRDEKGRWLEPDELAELGIAPFDHLVLAAETIRYRWSVLVQDGVRSYRGQPLSSPDLPWLLLRLPEDPALHESLWRHTNRGEDGPIPVHPESAGWREVLTATDNLARLR